MTVDAPKLDSQLLTPARLCWVLGVSERTEREWRDAKLITFFKQGHNIRYEPAKVLEFIARHTTQAKSLRPGTAGATAAIDVEAWAKIERLIADQVKAHLAKVLADGHQLEKAA